jgi:hypothetical protein
MDASPIEPGDLKSMFMDDRDTIELYVSLYNSLHISVQRFYNMFRS